ncbi:MAG: hypothetical protein ACXW1W_10530 [Methylococcaceae bacterium]
MKNKHGLIEFLLVLMLLGAITPSYAGDRQPKIHGKTYGEWSAKWWQWLRSIPAQSNPLLGSGLVDCSIGQSGPVVFLAGTTGIDSVDRECSVPKEKELFFSPFNFMFYNEPEETFSKAEKRKILDGILSDTDGADDVFGGSHTCNLATTVDDVPIIFSAITTARTQSPAFRIEIVDDDIFGGTAGTVDNSAISDGVWVMLSLPKGKHTLHVQGALCDLSNQPLNGFQQDYTYRLRVE